MRLSSRTSWSFESFEDDAAQQPDVSASQSGGHQKFYDLEAVSRPRTILRAGPVHCKDHPRVLRNLRFRTGLGWGIRLARAAPKNENSPGEHADDCARIEQGYKAISACEIRTDTFRRYNTSRRRTVLSSFKLVAPTAPSAAPTGCDNVVCDAFPEVRWVPCSTPVENRSADNRKSCWRRCDRSSFLLLGWPAASADEPLSTPRRAAASDRRSIR